jgi:hypothetical protein
MREEGLPNLRLEQIGLSQKAERDFHGVNCFSDSRQRYGLNDDTLRS